MRKYFLIFVIVELFTLCSCAPTGPYVTTTSDTTASDTTASDTTSESAPVYHTGDDIIYEDLFEITLEETDEWISDKYAHSDSSKFYGFKFRFVNLSDRQYTINSAIFNAYCNNEAYSVMVCSGEKELIDGTISPGREVAGWVCVEVPVTVDFDEVELEISPASAYLIGIWKK